MDEPTELFDNDICVVDAYCTLGEENDECLGAGELLAQMDRLGVAQALIAPGSRELAAENERGNSRIAAAAREHAARLIPAFSVNPWKNNALTLAQQALDDGGRLLILAPHRQGVHLGDSLWDPLLEWTCANQVPVYAHASPTASGTPSQLYFLADRHPEVRFLMGRCGTTDYAADMRPILELNPQNLWYDFGFVRPSALAAYAKIAPDRFCFASCAPQNDLEMELTFLRSQLPPDTLRGILGANFLHFLES